MRHRVRDYLGLMAAVLLAAGAAGADQGSYNVRLQLDGAIRRGGQERMNLTIEAAVREGAWQGWLRGSAVQVCKGVVHGSVQAEPTEKGVKLTVQAVLPRDLWVDGGIGRYEILLAPAESGDGYAGTYVGTFTPTKAKAPAAPSRSAGGQAAEPDANAPDWLKKELARKRAAANPGKWSPSEPVETRPIAVTGTVTGRRLPAWPVQVAQRPEPQAGQHPRLIFRAEQVAALREFVQQDPAGQAMMKQFWKVIDRQDQVRNRKFSLWPAVGYGFAWQMTGEKKYAEAARKHVERYNAPPGGQDIHHGPALMALALAYDLCYDGWDETFRAEITEELQQRTLESFTGTFQGRRMGGLNPSVWSNHNGIRASAAGLGALAIWGEANTQGDVLEAAEAIAHQCAWEAREYLRMGLGGGAWGMEGFFYRGMTMRRGLLAFVAAYPNVTGKAIQSEGYGEALISGYFIEAWPGRLFPRVEGYDGTGKGMDIDADTLPDLVWSMGAPLVPREQLPAYKSLLELTVGREGDGTYGIVRGFYAPFAVAGYPREVKMAPPGEHLPWISPDRQNGHWVFRPTWKTADDILMVLNLKSHILPACHHERSGTMSDFHLVGFGQEWISGQYHPELVDAPRAKADKNGPVTQQAWIEARTAVLKLDATHAYMPSAPKDWADGQAGLAKARQAGAIGIERLDWWNQPLADYGVRATRHLAVDASGVSGAPLLLVLVEQIDRKAGPEAAAKPTKVKWSLPLVGDGKKLTVEGNRVSLARGRSQLAGVVLGAQKLTGASASLSDGRVFVVLTLSQGQAPDLQVRGDGLDAVVQVGRRTVRFDGRRIVLAESGD